MGQLRLPQPVKLVLGMLSAYRDMFDQACRELTKQWGEIEAVSPVFPFYHTNYYQAEMGSDLQRRFVCFKELIGPEKLVDCKLFSNQIEEGFANKQGNRKINLDPGYLTECQLILASTKNYAHRIYLGKGVFAELTLQYKRKWGWQDLPWTYPDYRLATAKNFFLQVREQYRRQL